MAFEPFPSEAVQQFNDPGPYFIRENGKLRSPPGMGPHSRSLLEFSQETNPAATPANSTDHSENTPRKLFDMTLDFVAANVVLVDSLVGFPEVVGQQLFEASHRHGNLSINALRLFSDAYRDAVLRSINLSGHHLAINQHSNCLAVFPYLTELEVTGCRLGDDHEIISTIANCHSLTRLGLASNSLSDVGIQRLTAPLRVMRRGPRKLGILDLAGNNLISDKSAGQYLTVFTSLRGIDLSGCNISSAGLDVLRSKLRLETNNSTAPSPFHLPVKTVGWALPLIEQWIESSTDLMKRGKSKASKAQAHGPSNSVHFYGRARKRLENVSRSSLPKPKPLVFPVIQLVAATTNHGQPTSDPADKKVKRLKVKMTIDRLTKELKNPATCRQEVEACQSKMGASLSQTTFNKELIEQYAIGSRDTFNKNKQTRKQDHWSFVDVDSNDLKQSREPLILKQEPVRVTKPPPKKRIKLSTKASKGFSDVLPNQKVEGVVHGEPRSHKNPCVGQASDCRKSGDQSHMTSKDHGSCSNQRQSAEYVHRNQATSQKGNGLWKAMNSEDWG
ncbi:leucine-rich repeat-containing protein 42-like [Patiria miniata]|uniref:Leucine-rich repeat-containing protein 42 n=1 Tax=Patiria miniata TaxID=46514 RepID=A0A914AWV7_PATMI|nr:leucine-rich repeat-containing protein 42-like [Patiria miniata]XP_038068202.1 leucine-rich repeat-containing protein 42-like [Patiria miniata]XP_038068203.1 leucine-rich repeat-containing protein 42-like [Patiria miniata]